MAYPRTVVAGAAPATGLLQIPTGSTDGAGTFEVSVAGLSCRAARFTLATAAGTHARIANPWAITTAFPTTGFAEVSTCSTAGACALLPRRAGAVARTAADAAVLTVVRLAASAAACTDALLTCGAFLHRSAVGSCWLRRELALSCLAVTAVRRARIAVVAVGDGAGILAGVVVADVDPCTCTVRTVATVLAELLFTAAGAAGVDAGPLVALVLRRADILGALGAALGLLTDPPCALR